ncbi:MAG: putative DNA binding domain-containing protein [Clostridiales bacterium]|jgi:ATP-dependent DNA helicase RecG|nr:putative DNA binding domain-containing protein [Clostridiales bacterium]
MLSDELVQLIETVKQQRCETQHTELKKALGGTPKRLYDTLSSFSNQTGGGVIIFGVDQDSAYEICGVYDPQDLQARATEQANQMEPVVRPLFTVARIDGKTVVSAEIAECDINERPCYYRGAGKLRGSFTRVGDADLPMTEYEIYSYEVYRRKIQDERREIPDGIGSDIDTAQVNLFLSKARVEKPNLARLPDNDVLKLCGLHADGKPNLAGLLLFGLYPQANFPGFDITAVAIPGYQIGNVAADGARFINNKRVGGTIPQMLDGAMDFVHRTVKVRTIIDESGKRADKTEYPLKAIREIILNALIHRDYSVHTESSPIRIMFFYDRLEIENPGGLYGRLTLDELGKVGADTRNPAIAAALEILIDTENRFSGIPTIRHEMKTAGLPAPVFDSSRGVFRVTLYNRNDVQAPNGKSGSDNSDARLVAFCSAPRTRAELSALLNVSSISYMMEKYINPLLESGKLKMAIPDKPKSRNQKYYSE